MITIHEPDTDIYEAIETYVQKAEDGDYTHSTVKKRKRIPNQFMEKVGEKYEVEEVNDVSPQLIEEYVEIRRGDGISDITIRNEVTTLQGLLSLYNHFEFKKRFNIDELGLDTRTNVEKNNEDVPSIDEDEYIQLLEEAQCLRDELIFRIGWETGARRSEISNIDISDIDFDNREITIQQAKKDGTRPVFFDMYTKTKLKQYLNTNRAKYPNHNDTDALFLSHDGMRISHEHVNHKIADAAERAGIQDVVGTNSKGHDIRKVTAHSLRHSFALQRIDQGMPIKYIADLMGDSVKTVEETYLQTKKEDLRRSNQQCRPKVYSQITEI